MSDSESPRAEILNTKLPPLDDQPFAHIPAYRTAYTDIVAAEHHAVELSNAEPSCESLRDRVMCVQVVGLFLIEFYKKSFVLSESPCLGIVQQVGLASQRENGRDRIVELGESYRDYLIRYFLIASGKRGETWTPSRPAAYYRHDNEGTFETVKDMGNHWGEAVGNDYETVRKKVLVRDDYRCVSTGIRGAFVRDWCGELSSQPRLEASVPVKGCHIIWDYMADPIPKEGFSSMKFFEILEQLQLQDLVTDFTKSQGGIHNPRNMLSMRTDLGGIFHDLNVWFEPTSEPCDYTTHFDNPHTRKLFQPFLRDRVRFESKHGIPLPDRKLLTFHGICSRVGLQSDAVYWPREEWDDDEWDDDESDDDELSQEDSRMIGKQTSG